MIRAAVAKLVPRVSDVGASSPSSRLCHYLNQSSRRVQDGQRVRLEFCHCLGENSVTVITPASVSMAKHFICV